MKDYLGHSTLLVLITEIIKKETGMEHGAARRMAGTVKNGIAKTVKGNLLYIAIKDPDEVAARRAAIRRDYDGTSACRERLQRRWGISKATFFRIIKAD